MHSVRLGSVEPAAVRLYQQYLSADGVQFRPSPRYAVQSHLRYRCIPDERCPDPPMKNSKVSLWGVHANQDTEIIEFRGNLTICNALRRASSASLFRFGSGPMAKTCGKVPMKGVEQGFEDQRMVKQSGKSVMQTSRDRCEAIHPRGCFRRHALDQGVNKRLSGHHPLDKPRPFRLWVPGVVIQTKARREILSE